MPEIQIRPAVSADLPHLSTLEHDYTSDYVWQMEVVLGDGRMEVSFRQSRLPRSVRVDYPRPYRTMSEYLSRHSEMLVAVLEGKAVAYAALKLEQPTGTCWLTDMAVVRRLRRQGLASSLVLAAEEWTHQHGGRRLVLEMQPKNDPAVSLAAKLGYEFCGYNDSYYANNDIALFFAKVVR
jgi:ribosomal protein S18 acetylase RimI-like enzyme